MAKQKIFMLCDVCKGTGLVVAEDKTSLDNVCPRCNGEKHMEWGFLRVDDDPTP